MDPGDEGGPQNIHSLAPEAYSRSESGHDIAVSDEVAAAESAVAAAADAVDAIEATIGDEHISELEHRLWQVRLVEANRALGEAQDTLDHILNGNFPDDSL